MKTSSQLDSELDAYMGEDSVKARLNSQLDAYFKSESAATAATDVVMAASQSSS